MRPNYKNKQKKIAPVWETISFEVLSHLTTGIIT